MKHIIFIIAVLITFSSCENKVVKDKKTCVELPNFVINKKIVGEKIIAIECYLDDNSIHQFQDGEQKINIVPIFINESNNKILFVNKEALIGLDTIDLKESNLNTIKYSVMFPSPKGGDVKIFKVVDAL